MDAVEYLKTRKRMCESTPESCSSCPLSVGNNGIHTVCDIFINTHPEQAVAIVEQWAEEHPVKTRQSELMKLFPNLEVDVFGMCIICPRHFDTKFECSRFSNCRECCENYWLEELEEEE